MVMVHLACFGPLCSASKAIPFKTMGSNGRHRTTEVRPARKDREAAKLSVWTALVYCAAAIAVLSIVAAGFWYRAMTQEAPVATVLTHQKNAAPANSAPTDHSATSSAASTSH